MVIKQKNMKNQKLSVEMGHSRISRVGISNLKR